MDLHHLRTFVAVAEENHLTRAAERLFVSQSAVSSHIKALEGELGVVLFHRTPKGMTLSREGERLLGRVRRILDAMWAVPTVKAGALECLIALFVRGDLPLYVEFIGRPGQFPLNVRESDSDLSG